VNTFARKFCQNPEYIKAENEGEKPVSKIKHYYIETNSAQKNHTLFNFLRLNRNVSVIVFANTKRKVEQIKESLTQKGLRVDYIHSGLSQSRRFRVFTSFKKKQVPLLIATDVAARGLDVKDISFVVNYDFPQNREFYIHRTGRTGRAGASGKAVTFVNSLNSKEKNQLSSFGEQKGFKIEKFNNLTG
jgi:ATP-dependent RNA helicase DeaD